MKYRPEIDGLRALAVVPVIFFHAGFEWISGGFVGVDIFFVISGYLITSLIVSDLEKGEFSLVNFYERRIRRILPALIAVTLVCIPFAWFWFGAVELKDFAQSVGALALFSSNVLFWTEDGYFETSAEFKPLLHTWSLSVEEQFYALFPCLMILLWWIRNKTSMTFVWFILTGLFAVSLVISELHSHSAPKTAYFLLHTRFWELLLGSFTALFSTYHRLKLMLPPSNLISLLGFFLILYSILFFNQYTPFPSLYTLLPTVGTVMIIIGANKGTVLHSILSTKLLVTVGLISYSAYLWHHPILVFAKYKAIFKLSDAVLIAICVATLPLAYLTWKYVEQPFRNRNYLSRRLLFACAFASLTSFLVFGAVTDHYQGFSGRLNVPAQIEQTMMMTEQANDCFAKESIHTADHWYCQIGDQTEEPSFIMFGDSHSLSLFPTFEAAARETGIAGYFTGTYGCPPLLLIYRVSRNFSQNCHLLNERILEFVIKSNIKNVFLVSRWTYYTNGIYGDRSVFLLTLDETSSSSVAESRQVFAQGLKHTLETYTNLGLNLARISHKFKC